MRAEFEGPSKGIIGYFEGEEAGGREAQKENSIAIKVRRRLGQA